MRILNAYIRTHVFYSILIVLLVVTGLELLIEFLGQLNNITAGHYSLAVAALYVLMQLPTDIYQFFPMAGFLGCLIGLGRLASSSELIVMRAAGVSVVQITWSVIKAAGILIVLITILGEVVAPDLAVRAEQFKSTYLNHHHSLLAEHVWLRKGERFIHIDGVRSKKEIQGVTVFERKGVRTLQAVSYAARGVYRAGQWHLLDVHKTVFGDGALKKEVVSDWPVGFQLNFKLLERHQEDVSRDSSKNLWASTQYSKQQGLESTRYELAFWMRVLQPFTSVIMICLGVPFMFGSLRHMTLSTRIVTGVFVGFAFYMVNQFFGPMTLVYQWPPLFVATLPPLLFGSVCVVMLLRTR